MVPLLKFFCWEDVRIAAVHSLEPLLRSAKLAVQKQVPGATPELLQQMLHYLWTHLMGAIEKEHEPTVIDCMVDAIGEITDLLPDMISGEQQQQAFKVSGLSPGCTGRTRINDGGGWKEQNLLYQRKHAMVLAGHGPYHGLVCREALRANEAKGGRGFR